MALQGMRLVNCIRAREHLSYTKKSLETWTLVESLTYSTTSSCTFSGNGILSLREHTEVEAFCLVKVAPLPRERLQVRESRGLKTSARPLYRHGQRTWSREGDPAPSKDHRSNFRSDSAKINDQSFIELDIKMI